MRLSVSKIYLENIKVINISVDRIFIMINRNWSITYVVICSS